MFPKKKGSRSVLLHETIIPALKNLAQNETDRQSVQESLSHWMPPKRPTKVVYPRLPLGDLDGICVHNIVQKWLISTEGCLVREYFPSIQLSTVYIFLLMNQLLDQTDPQFGKIYTDDFLSITPLYNIFSLNKKYNIF